MQFSWGAMGPFMAMLAGEPQVQTPPATMATIGGDGNTGRADRSTSSPATTQASKSRQNVDANAAMLADYARSQARYENEMKSFEAAKAAIARKTAADAAAYRERLAAWSRDREVVVRAPKRPPAQVASTTTAGSPSKIVCVMETPTGSVMAVRHCRTVAQIDANHDKAVRNLDMNSQSGGVRLVNLP